MICRPWNRSHRSGGWYQSCPGRNRDLRHQLRLLLGQVFEVQRLVKAQELQVQRALRVHFG